MIAKLNVALTGASGFVGGHILKQLLTAGHRVRALVRRPNRFDPPVANAKLTVVKGTLLNAHALDQLVDDVDAIIHVVGIIMQVRRKGQTFARIHVDATQRLIAAANAASVKRCIHMSALGTRPEADSAYHRTKWQAESALRESGLDYTIFRPSIIHGPDGEFMEMVKAFWCNLFPPFVPFFSATAGFQDVIAITTSLLWPFPSLRRQHDRSRYVSSARAGRLQPVWVEDVARCFVGALDIDKTIKETYPLGGPDVFTWPQLFQTCQQHYPNARNKKIVALPVWYAKLIAGKPLVPFNRDQVVMSQEDSICDTGKVQSHIGIELAPFERKFSEYAGQIR